MDVKLINELEKEISNDYSFSRNTRRKNYFLAACKSLDPEINLLQIDEQSPFGGIIGIDDSPRSCSIFLKSFSTSCSFT